MKSRNARFLKQGLIEEYRQMSPHDRVRAFIKHSFLMKKIKEAGDAKRKALTGKKPDNG